MFTRSSVTNTPSLSVAIESPPPTSHSKRNKPHLEQNKLWYHNIVGTNNKHYSLKVTIMSTTTKESVNGVKNVAESAQVQAQATAQEVTPGFVANPNFGKTEQDIVRQLLKDGASINKGVTVRTVSFGNSNITDTDHFNVYLTLDQPVKGFRQTDDGNWEETTTNVIRISLYTATAIVKTIPEAAFMAKSLETNPKALMVLFAGMTCDVLQQFVQADSDYLNPFSQREEIAPYHMEHDSYYYHVSNVVLGTFAKGMLSQAALAILGV